MGVDVNDHRNALPFTVAAQGGITHEDTTMEVFQLVGNAASNLLKRSAKNSGQSGQDGYTQLVEGIDTEVLLEKSWQLPDIVKMTCATAWDRRCRRWSSDRWWPLA